LPQLESFPFFRGSQIECLGDAPRLLFRFQAEGDRVCRARAEFGKQGRQFVCYAVLTDHGMSQPDNTR